MGSVWGLLAGTNDVWSLRLPTPVQLTSAGEIQMIAKRLHCHIPVQSTVAEASRGSQQESESYYNDFRRRCSHAAWHLSTPFFVPCDQLLKKTHIVQQQRHLFQNWMDSAVFKPSKSSRSRVKPFCTRVTSVTRLSQISTPLDHSATLSRAVATLTPNPRVDPKTPARRVCARSWSIMRFVPAKNGPRFS